jgi:hypothetical protein
MHNIATIRINERNNIKFKRKDLLVNIKRDDRTIERLRNERTNVDFNKNKIESLKRAIQKRECEISILDARERDLDCGNLDRELLYQIQDNAKIIKKKNNETFKRKSEQRELDNKNKKKALDFKNSYIQSGRNQRRLERNIKSDEYYYYKLCSYIPDYIIKNLSKMPNNRGYIWKDIYCYGDLPAVDGEPVILHERKPKNTTIIHEWKDDIYRIYQRVGRDKKTLLSSKARKLRV